MCLPLPPPTQQPGALQESFQKALRSLETGCDGWSLPRKWKRMDNQQLVYNLRVPNPERVLVIKQVTSVTHDLSHTVSSQPIC